MSGASISEEEDMKCIKTVHVETINEETKGISSEEEEIGIRKFRRRSKVENINKEEKGWTSSSK